MRVYHEGAVLANDVEVTRSWFGRARGLMGRSSVPDDYALVFVFGRAANRAVHTVLVRTAIDVVWVVDSEVTRRATLPAWTGYGRARADTIVELAPGATAEVAAGDRLTVAESD